MKVLSSFCSSFSTLHQRSLTLTLALAKRGASPLLSLHQRSREAGITEGEARESAEVSRGARSPLLAPRETSADGARHRR